MNTQHLESIRGSLERKTPRACGCAHECTVAQHFSLTSIGETTNRDIALTLCPQTVQDANPCCAHATLFFGPDTFTAEIEELVNLGIINRSEWEERARRVQQEIGTVDVAAAAAVARGNYNLAEIQQMQQPIVNELTAMKRELLSVIAEHL